MKLLWLSCAALLSACIYVKVDPALAAADPKAIKADLTLESGEDDDSGFLLGSPVAVTTASNGKIQLLPAGFTGVWSPGPIQPDFAALNAWFAVAGVSASPILAMSLGFDVIVVSPPGLVPDGLAGEPFAADQEVVELLPSTHGWIALQLSVDRDEVGSLSDVATDVLAAGSELDATLFSYLAPGSDAVMLSIEWTTVRAKTAAELVLDPSDKIDGLDMSMALYGTNLTEYPDFFTTREPTPEPWVYFTLHPGYLHAIADAAASPPSWVTAPNSGTIYKSHWVSGAWSEPEPYLTAAAMGHDGHAVIIDGLAIDVEEVDGSTQVELMYSLRPGSEIYHFKVGDPPPLKPRIVVVRPPPGSYRRLGRQLAVGDGLGDFCTKDPFVSLQAPVTKNDPVLDDFFIARRLRPAEAWAEPARLPEEFRRLVDWSAYGVYSPPFVLPGPSGPRIAAPTLATARKPFLVTDRVYLAHPSRPTLIPLPELALAVAGYRQQGSTPTMRTCMSWPRPLAKTGQAYVWWGTMADFLDSTKRISWEPEPVPMEYLGHPIHADHPLPDGNPGSKLPSGDDRLDPRRVMVAQWRLEAGGKTYISPISALRY